MSGLGTKAKTRWSSILQSLSIGQPCGETLLTTAVGVRHAKKHSKLNSKSSPMKEREIVTARTERVCVDLVGPLPKGRGGVEHILTCIDIATRWPEAVAIKSTTTQTVISKLKEIFARQGMPGVLVSDNGPQFSSTMFKDFCRREEIKHMTAAP